jgi:hypothetical protein
VALQTSLGEVLAGIGSSVSSLASMSSLCCLVSEPETVVTEIEVIKSTKVDFQTGFQVAYLDQTNLDQTYLDQTEKDADFTLAPPRFHQ